MDDITKPNQTALYRVRRTIGLIGFGLPIALLLSVYIFSVPMMTAISKFYFTGMRDVFVFSLCAIGVFLISYHGYEPDEGTWLTDWRVSTVAGVCAILVALVPTGCNGSCYFPLALSDQLITSDDLQGYIHTGSAGLFLACLAIFCLVLFTQSDQPCPTPDKVLRNMIYRACGYIIVAMIVLLFAFKLLFSDIGETWDAAWHFTFWAESMAVWAFAISWLIKGETLRTNATVFLYGANRP